MHKDDSAAPSGVGPGASDDWQHLRGYGYAPGNYMNKCRRCQQVVSGVDKRAVTCRPCAEAMDAKSPQPDRSQP